MLSRISMFLNLSLKKHHPQSNPHHLNIMPSYKQPIYKSMYNTSSKGLFWTDKSQCLTIVHNFFCLIQQNQVHRVYHTPEIQPIDHDITKFMLTPLQKNLKIQDMSEFVDEFSLDAIHENYSQRRRRNIAKRDQKRRQRENQSQELLFILECDLEKIVEDQEQLSYQSEQNDQDSEVSQDQSEQSQKYEEIKISQKAWENRLKSQDTNIRDTEEEKHTIFELSPVDFSQNIERFIRNPKQQILKGIKEIETLKQVVDQAQKITNLKKYLQQYLLQFQTYCFDEAWKELAGDFRSITKLISIGIQQMFARKIGPINFEQRRVKLLKYLEKKKRRIWRKKVSYDCRKKVADGRLRIKGKFVTRQQACQQLGVENLDNYSPEQIKQMLQRRMDNNLLQSSMC